MMSTYNIGAGAMEVLSEDFLTHLKELNLVVQASKSPLEGNLFYHHHDADFATKTSGDPRRAPKRRNLHRALYFKKSLLEIGLNAGHSALLALSTNPVLKYVGVDICKNTYTRSAANYLKSVFGDRFELIEGDSRSVLPYLRSHRRDLSFDAFHVDGNHGISVCRSDITSCLMMSGPGQHLILDDTSAPQIMNIFLEYVSLGHLVTESLGQSWEGNTNLLARIIGEVPAGFRW